ncbi:hypothetical protein FisN_24Lh210 [Fistulifera solaris]|uniref:Uncharacterized protein n=1 Tax=Fistulifera solaris TaxID=1519565 RepID=A0A1Z5K9Y8_FISSO|nr:hypothetical protein FisN_24Lh210 [Fistulifera solaris]|eukprot:GAX22921.1 hypothetical protein FisN_24Lh210 [Fistulifera solaris]
MSESVEMLEKRIQALEVGSQYESTKQAVQNAEKQHLETLRQIKAALLNETGSSSSKEVERLMKENEELKKKNAKLEYRVNHMATCMEELYERNKQLRA